MEFKKEKDENFTVLLVMKLSIDDIFSRLKPIRETLSLSSRRSPQPSPSILVEPLKRLLIDWNKLLQHVIRAMHISPDIGVEITNYLLSRIKERDSFIELAATIFKEEEQIVPFLLEGSISHINLLVSVSDNVPKSNRALYAVAAQEEIKRLKELYRKIKLSPELQQFKEFFPKELGMTLYGYKSYLAMQEENLPKTKFYLKKFFFFIEQYNSLQESSPMLEIFILIEMIKLHEQRKNFQEAFNCCQFLVSHFAKQVLLLMNEINRNPTDLLLQEKFKNTFRYINPLASMHDQLLQALRTSRKKEKRGRTSQNQINPAHHESNPVMEKTEKNQESCIKKITFTNKQFRHFWDRNQKITLANSNITRIQAPEPRFIFINWNKIESTLPLDEKEKSSAKEALRKAAEQEFSVETNYQFIKAEKNELAIAFKNTNIIYTGKLKETTQVTNQKGKNKTYELYEIDTACNMNSTIKK